MHPGRRDVKRPFAAMRATVTRFWRGGFGLLPHVGGSYHTLVPLAMSTGKMNPNQLKNRIRSRQVDGGTSRSLGPSGLSDTRRGEGPLYICPSQVIENPTAKPDEKQRVVDLNGQV